MICSSCGTDAGDSSKFCPSCGATLVRAAESDDYLGKTILQKYRVEALIGEGGMGKVYRAKQIALDKPVVLKVLRQSLLSDKRTVARFQREAKAASRLNHPNSISILDFGQADDGSLFIAMEYVSGKDLHQILSTEWPLPEPRVVRIISQVLSALGDAHGAGVIHRDLKPENIMVEQRRGEPDFVKVLDFGIAKISDASEEGPALTRAGFVCGTPEYMSPEQARGASLDARSDLYSVGVILYQLTTGLLPFESDSAVGFATKHLTEEPPPPTRRRPDAKVSPGMERLILRALSKNPDERPATAEAFRTELLALVDRRGAAMPKRSAPMGRGSAAPRMLSEEVTFSSESTVTVPPEELGAPPPPRLRSVAADEATHVDPHPAARDSLAPPPTPGVLVFKVATIALVVISLGLAGVFLFQTYVGGTPAPAPAVTSEPAPARAAMPERPLYEVEVPSNLRDPAGAEQLALQGDEAHQRGDHAQAAEKYELAFRRDPTPELSLKLGELYHQRNEVEKARGWWARHLRDRSDSLARSYIQQQYPDL